MIFDSHTKDVSGEPLSTVDFLLRASLMDGFITEALLKPVFQLLGSLRSEQDVPLIQSRVALLTKTLPLVASSLFRQQH